MKNDSLALVSSMQREIDICNYHLGNILLNLSCDSYQTTTRNEHYPPCFEVAHSFFSFLVFSHPEVLEEWEKTRKKD